ncbi:hypothetical protein WHT83_11180 [Aminobacter sp. P9b]|uniref:Uncharacterized protein n=1 Tax=Aminobacter niigataensis TaxID=83265 RepID=A0ABR6L5M3_9HYPH|nr:MULTISPECIES: hypothetical protein [Aminobacter]AWC25035.1 hypothetical protein CO731_04529 [Aminobacter sp. MSH1]MBB4651928.1 hypothetical protein [Aminobacter niigataensis]
MTIASENPDNEMRRELNRRLNIVADPSYGDPARADISGRDLGIWFATTAAILIVALAMWSGGN